LFLPKVSRNRVIAAPIESVWGLVSDPHSLPRWWPKTTRVEDVRERDGEPGMEWTSVLGTEKGKGIRADYRCTATTEPTRYAWVQALEDSPFERVLRSAEVVIELSPQGESTEVTLRTDESLRGLSRLGSPMMRGAARGRLDEALDGLERALT
jgi:uncharacterized protein YndB with AHSA1/START domain